jgi:3-hydroxybutyryl-CoA dehydrogenase
MIEPAEQCGVVGAGTMGQGIAICYAQAGHAVILRDVSSDRVETGLASIRRFVDRGVERGAHSRAAADAIVSRITAATALEDLAACDVVVEAVPESPDLKRDLFATLDDMCAPTTLFHTNTSTLSIASIAAASRHPERVVGTHFCNPAPLMRLVEVVPGRRTDDAALGKTTALIRRLGKTPVLARDTPGFIVNYLWVPFENDCIRMVEAQRASPADLDLAVKAGLGFPMGTFRLLDIVGLDVHRAVSLSLYEQLHDPRFAPPPLVDRMISAGQLGRKTGEGFYSYA